MSRTFKDRNVDRRVKRDGMSRRNRQARARQIITELRDDGEGLHCFVRKLARA